MPVPKPSSGEDQKTFISRCVSQLSREDPNRDQKQVLAICYSQWNESIEQLQWHPDFKRILGLFLKRYGEKLGLEKLNHFLAEHGLNPSLPYHPKYQFSESFNWLDPHIQFFKQDKQAKYYKIKCIHAITSMNNRSYENWNQMMAAGKSMNFRPVNINHDHGRWQPYPRTRLDYAKAEDYCVEGVLRVDNQDKRLQMQLDHDPRIPEKEWISHPSIEGRPDLGGDREGYHFTGIALLEKGYQLPGDPLTEIAPLIMEGMPLMESVGNQVCMIVGGEEICLECQENIPEDQKEGNKIEKAEGPINPEGAVCPQCGHKITPDPTIEASAIKCPRCGTQMERLPQRAYEMLTEEQIKELFRPPFNGDLDSYNKMFKKTTGADLLTSTIPSVGPVQGATIGIVESTKIEMLEKEHGLELAKLKDSHQNQIKVLNEKIATLNEELSSQKRINAKGDTLQAELSEKQTQVADLKTEISLLKGEAKGLNEKMGNLELKLRTKQEDYSNLSEDYAKLKQRLEDRIAEHQRDLEKATKNAQTATNEIQNRARLQEEVSELREELATLTRRYSDLTEKSYGESKRIEELEKELSEKVKLVQTTKDYYEAQLGDLRETIEKARKYQKWSEKLLKEAGYVKAE